MRSKIGRHYHYAVDSDCPGRPSRVPTEAEARVALARDLCRDVWGVDSAKLPHVMHSPLMDVALDGLDGVAIAEARDWRLAA